MAKIEIFENTFGIITRISSSPRSEQKSSPCSVSSYIIDHNDIVSQLLCSFRTVATLSSTYVNRIAPPCRQKFVSHLVLSYGCCSYTNFCSLRGVYYYWSTLLRLYFCDPVSSDGAATPVLKLQLRKFLSRRYAEEMCIRDRSLSKRLYPHSGSVH